MLIEKVVIESECNPVWGFLLMFLFLSHPGPSCQETKNHSVRVEDISLQGLFLFVCLFACFLSSLSYCLYQGVNFLHQVPCP